MKVKTGVCPRCGTRYYQRGDRLYICDCMLTKPDGSLMAAYDPAVDSLSYGSRAMQKIRNPEDRSRRSWRVHFWDGGEKNEENRPVEVKMK
ncbi:hypothetical protein [Candidatus Hecatella orcuttiae]|uniref:hypothetical protein n=1 Tax=Candidatus Hecatella orcuttiae TaxID=1935119 RepID=UPI0028682C12|nr:hypothetical protein [Candidatus Hecatella orcuttiae]